MPIEKNGTAPYAPTRAVMSVIQTYRDHSPRVPFTAENLEPIEHVAAGTAPRTLQALKLLGLADDDGHPTAALEGLKQAGRNEFQDRLADVVRAAYGEVFAYRDPTTASPEDIEDAFRAFSYSPASMRPRMMRLFYGLCMEAGIVSEKPRIASEKTVRSRTSGRVVEGAFKGKKTKPAPSHTPPTPPAVLPPVVTPPAREGLHPALNGLLALIPDGSKPWESREERDTFFKAWEAAMDAIHPLPQNGSGSGSKPEVQPDAEPAST